MLVGKNDIESLIPQRPPIVMVDELLHSDELSTRCSFTVTPDNIFTQDDTFREPGLIEHVAQTAAAGVGYQAKKNNTPVPVGYIGAIKNLEIASLPKTGDRLETEVTVINNIFDVTSINGTVHCNGALVASCEMKIFISKQQ